MVEALDLRFTLLLVSNGVLIGLMYSLIALGFVLVYKATDAVNFAQGEFVMIAGFVVVGGLTVAGAPLWLSVIAGIAGMVGFGFALERVMLRKLIGRPVIAVVMATIGIVKRASIVRLKLIWTMKTSARIAVSTVPALYMIAGPVSMRTACRSLVARAIRSPVG